ncbi:MAG: hypothetical protein AAGA75_21810 [Cyanobacteria bacterium P01_E01_bin.6]
MSKFYKGAIAVHKPTNKLFRAERLRDGLLFPGESSVCFKAEDCRVANADDIPTNRPFVMRVGDVFIHIRFDEELDQFIVTDGNKCIGVRIPLEHCEFFEQAVGRFARFFDGAIADEADEPEMLAHWKKKEVA